MAARMPATWRPAHAPTRSEQVGQARQRQQRADERRGTAHERGYDSRWTKSRRGYLARHPLCCCCEANGRTVPATVIDHVVPHKGDKARFWDRANWQGLCRDCHGIVKARLEARFEQGRIGAAELNLARPLPEFFPAV